MTDSVSAYGINVPKTYCDAYTSYGVRCVIGTHVPNNAGSLSTIKVLAPPGCIVNAMSPAPVSARSVIGQLLPDVVFGALCQPLPRLVPAESSSSLWNLRLSNAGTGQRRYSITTFNTGGMGARPGLDGLAATSFPAGVRNVPLEIMESVTPLVFWRKALRDGSGGHGCFRGGDGQVIEVGHRHGEAFTINATFERIIHPARGRDGGHDGSAGRVSLKSGLPLKAMGRQTIPAGDHLVAEMPGGGGIGDPRQRARAHVAADVSAGRISADVARITYDYNFSSTGVAT